MPIIFGPHATVAFVDIVTRVMNALRMPVTNQTEVDKITPLVNDLYRDIWVKEDWWFLWKRTVINTEPKYVPTSCSVTAGSDSVTALVPIPTVSLTGYVMLVPGASQDGSAVYRVSSHNAGEDFLTLDAPYTDVTASTSPRFYKDAYALPVDCGKVLVVKRFGEPQPLRRVGLNELSQQKLIDTTEHKPEVYSVFDKLIPDDPTSQHLLQLGPYPDKAYRLEVWYKQTLTADFLPDEYRSILLYGSLARAYPIFLNDTQRGEYYQKLFNDMLSLIVAAHREYTKDKPQMQPDDIYRRHRRNRSASAVTYGSWFDRLPISLP